MANHTVETEQVNQFVPVYAGREPVSHFISPAILLAGLMISGALIFPAAVKQPIENKTALASNAAEFVKPPEKPAPNQSGSLFNIQGDSNTIVLNQEALKRIEPENRPINPAMVPVQMAPPPLPTPQVPAPDQGLRLLGPSYN